MPYNPMVGKGPLRHSEKVRTATDSATSSDVDNFDRGGLPGKRHLDAGVNPVKVISTFANLGEALKRSGTFREVAEQISQISEMAEQTIMQEAGDWFDAQTIKRNMKELKSYSKDFGKIAEEMDAMQQRATALYDDMGNVLARYFEMANGGKEPEEAPMGGDDVEEIGTVNPEVENDPVRYDIDPDFDSWEDKQYGTDKSGKPNKIHPSSINRKPDDRHAWKYKNRSKKQEAGTPGSQGIDAARLDAIARKVGIPTRQPGEDYADYRDRIRKAADKTMQFTESAVAPNAYNARRSLKLPKALQRTHGGFTRDDAKNVLKKGGAKTVSEAKKVIYKEIIRLAEEGKVLPSSGK